MQRFTPLAWLCESAGLLGIVAMLLASSLAFGGYAPGWVWAAIGLSAVCNTIYIVYVLSRRATGGSNMSWRELLLAILVPVAALVVTIILAGELGGLWHLPFVGGLSSPQA